MLIDTSKTNYHFLKNIKIETKLLIIYKIDDLHAVREIKC
jgi:hypothetical protein